MRRALTTLFAVEPGEAPAVALTLLQSVLIGLPRLFSITVAGAVFLDRYPAENLPLVFIAGSVVIPVAGLVHLTSSRRLSFLRLQLATLLVLATVTAGLLLLLDLTSARWPAFLLFVWYGVEFHLTNVVLWTTANRIFTVRQGKRLFGLIGSGEIIAAIVGGALTPLLTRFMGTNNLLLLSLAGLLCAAGNLGLVARVCRQQLARDRSTERGRRPESFAALLRSRYLVLIFVTYALVLSAGFFVNNIFFYQLGERFSSAAELAGFLGRFFAVYSLLSLVLRSFLSGRLLLRFGLLGGLLSAPLVILAAAMTVAALGWSGAGVVPIFWAVVGMRLVEKLFLGSFSQPAYYTLYQPLSRERRARVQTTAETISGPVAGGLTGLVLLFLTKSAGLGSVGLSAALIPMLLLWIAVCIAASRGFRTALISALRRRGISGSDLAVSDPTSLRILERGLESHRPMEVLYCLRLLEGAEHPRFCELVTGLLGHDSPEVRQGAAAVLERLADGELLPLLRDQLQREQDGPARRALLLALAAAGGPEVRQLVELYLESDDEPTRRGALVALIRYCGGESSRSAVAELQVFAGSREPGERIFAARALGELQHPALGPLLQDLLTDDEPEVRRAALQAVGAATEDETWRKVIANLELPALRAEAIRTLVGAGTAAHQVLETTFHAERSSRRLQRLILQLYGRSSEQESIRLLLDKLGLADRGLLGEALWSLHLCAYQAPSSEAGSIEACLQEEVAYGTRMHAAAHALSRQAGVELLASALTQELVQVRRRVLLLLSFLYDAESMLKILTSLGGSAAQRDLALELLESRVERRHTTLTMPILTGRIEHPPTTAAAQIRRLLLDDEGWISSWLRACAVDAAGSVSGALSRKELQALAGGPDELVRETARYTLRRSTATSHAAQAMPILERVRSLRGVSIFKEIDDEILAELARELEEVRVEPGEQVYQAGDLGRSLYIVGSGRLRLHLGDEAISELRAGEIFGELSVLEAEARTETASAVERCLLFRLHEADLHTFMATRIEVVRGIIAVLCHRVRVAPTDRLADRKDREQLQITDMPVSIYGDDYLSSLEKVLILKTAEIFSEVADDILAEVAARAEEVRLKRNEALFTKGDPGTKTYIVAAGRIRIHIADQWIADAGERAVVGELAALSSEPRTASVTAAEDTLLLAIDQGSLFELMWDQHEIVRGIIRVLVARLRRLRSSVSEAPPARIGNGNG